MDEPESRLRVTDVRGRTVSMLDPYLLRLLHRYDSIPRDALAEVAADLGSGLTRWARLFFVIGAICALPGFVAFVVQIVRIVRAGGMVWPLPKWLFLANLWVVPFVFGLAASQTRRRRIRVVMLKHRRCPHCGYDLRLLPVDAKDGATVCPECGCAWKLAPVQQSE